MQEAEPLKLVRAIRLADAFAEYGGAPWKISMEMRPCRHCEIAGSEFPFSRGVSFYEVNSDGLIVAGRDLVESAAKPGGAALKVQSWSDFS